MHINQFRYGKGNLAYLLWKNREAIVIDGGAVQEITDFLSERNLTLKLVTNTHGHDDHTKGNRALLDVTDADFLSAGELLNMSHLLLADEKITIIPTPGHTMDSLVFSWKDILITGDTLFNGTVGNCYSGEYEIYFQSLKKLTGRPGESRILAGHDLVKYSLGVIRKIDPENPYTEEYNNRYSRDYVVTTLSDELKVNPFIRFNDPSLDIFRNTLALPVETEYEKWRAMMTVH